MKEATAPPIYQSPTVAVAHFLQSSSQKSGLRIFYFPTVDTYSLRGGYVPQILNYIHTVPIGTHFATVSRSQNAVWERRKA